MTDKHAELAALAEDAPWPGLDVRRLRAVARRRVWRRRATAVAACLAVTSAAAALAVRALPSSESSLVPATQDGSPVEPVHPTQERLAEVLRAASPPVPMLTV